MPNWISAPPEEGSRSRDIAPSVEAVRSPLLQNHLRRLRRLTCCCRPTMCRPNITPRTPCMTDFIVDPIVDVATEFIDSVGLVGVFLLMLLESACLPVPSEAIMLFAGFNVSEGDMTLFGIVAAGVAGNVVGSWIAWGAGYYGRMELLEKNRLIHINHKHLDWADSWFQRHGDATVFFTRMLPIIRTFISLPAGRRTDAVLALHPAHARWAASPGC